MSDEHRPLPLAEEPPPPSRKCGNCSACCTVVGVAELEKPANVRCEHLGKGKHACKIYDERPESCAGYQCYWTHGMASWQERPDKVGLIVDASPQLQAMWGRLAVQVREVWPGASRSKKGDKLIAKLAQEGISQPEAVVFILTTDGKRKFVSFNAERRAQFAAMVEQHGQP